MGELGLNKIFGAILAAALIVMGLQTLSGIVFPSGAHHGGGHGEEKPYNEAIKDKYAYWTEVEGGNAGPVEEGPAYDLGLLLASADASKGERVFKSVCSSCHTIDQGGANGTGPNLYGLVGRDIANTAGFGYSSALGGVEGDWTYEQLDAWIDDPKNIARGVNMVANVKKDPDRANLIAYLAANTPGAAAFPAPLPEESEAPAEGDVEPASMEDGEPSEGGTEVTVDGTEVPMTDEEFDATLDEMESIVEDMEEIAEEMNEALDEAEMPEAPAVPVEEPAMEVVRPDGEN